MKNISIVILTYNALHHVKKCIESLTLTTAVDYNVVVVDNASETNTKQYLHESMISGKIDILCNLESNRLFSKGNNIGVKISPIESNYVLLLNSDVEIIDPLWLKKLVDAHEQGITTYGSCNANKNLGLPIRGDGYCLLIDRHLYEKFWLDESFPWYWSVTKIQGEVLSCGYSVQAIKDHINIINHYGGGSGDSFKQAQDNVSLNPSQIGSWFGSHTVKIL